MYILYTDDDGRPYVVTPAPGITDLDALAATVVPQGKEYQIVEEADIPVWDEPIPVPDSVSARQFKLQLLAAGLLDQVEGWVSQQPKAVQIAYDNSGAFVRGEPMMQQGFSDLGFTDEQIDAFFVAAAQL